MRFRPRSEAGRLGTRRGRGRHPLIRSFGGRLAEVADRSKDSFTSEATQPAKSQETAAVATAKVELEVIAGPDRGVHLTFDGTAPRILVGKGPACDFRLTDALVSRRHF